MRDKLPLVSVVIVNFNGREYLSNCLGSLSRLNYPKDKLEIIMVDNGSTDGSVSLIKKSHPEVTLLQNDVNNYARANNLGIRNAKGSFIALINNDVKVDKDWLIKLIECIQTDKKIGAVGSKILFMDGLVQSVGHEEYPNFYWGDIGFRDKDTAEYNIIKEVISICGCSVLYREKCLKDVGFLDEDFNMFLEDIDISIRCKKNGWKLMVCPESVIYHKLHGTVMSQEKARYLQEINRLILIAKHWPEKLADALPGKDYFTVNNGYSNDKDISNFLARIFVKLIKEHGLEVANRLSGDLFVSVRKIYNLEKNHLIQLVEDANQELSLKENHISLKVQEYEKLKYQKEEEITVLRQDYENLKQQKEEEISAKAKECENLKQQKEEEISAKIQELDSKNQELSLKENHISSLRQEYANLKQVKEEEITDKIQEYESLKLQKESHISSLRQEYENLKRQKEEEISAKIQELDSKNRELSLKENHIAVLRQEYENLKRQKEEEISAKIQELDSKNRELSLKENHIAVLRQDYENLKQQKEEEISARDKEYEKLKQQREEDLFAKARELDSSKQELFLKDLEIGNYNTSLRQVKAELRGVYGSTGYRLILKPLWSILWPVKVCVKKALKFIFTKRITIRFNFTATLKAAKARSLNFLRGLRQRVMIIRESVKRRVKLILTERLRLNFQPKFDFKFKPRINFKLNPKLNFIIKPKANFIDLNKIKDFFAGIPKNIKYLRNIFASEYSFKRIYLDHLSLGTYPVLPRSLSMKIIDNCNLSCKFCDIPGQRNAPTRMSKENAFKVIDSAANFGIKNIGFTGGEPLLHPDLFEIAGFAKSKGMEVVLSTNGILAAENIDKITQLGFSCVCVSIDGKEKTHDNLRSLDGAYKITIDSIRALKERKVNTSINFVVTNKNIHELEEVYDYFFQQNIKLSFFPVINKPEFFLSKPQDKKIYTDFITKLFRRERISKYEYYYLKKALTVYFSRKKARVRCLGLVCEFGVDVDGSISPCCVWNNRKDELSNLGNVFNEEVGKLWFSPRIRQARVSIFRDGCDICFNPGIMELERRAGIPYIIKKREVSEFTNKINNTLAGIAKPKHVHFRFTSRCNLSCRHCDIWKGNAIEAQKNELTAGQWKQAIDNLSVWLGSFRLDLAGGEILLYKDAIELIGYCASKGINVSLTTNASLVNDEIAKKLVDSRIHGINLSLDGLSKTHEYTRNKEELFDKVRQAALSLVKYRGSSDFPYLSIATVITRYNLTELPELIKLAAAWGVNGVNFQVLDNSFGSDYHSSWFVSNDFWPKDYKLVEDTLNYLIKEKLSGVDIINSVSQLEDMKRYFFDPVKNSKQPCSSGDRNFIIDESGGVRLCWNMKPVGNILKQLPEDIWHSNPASVNREKIMKCSRTCRMLNCNYAQ